MVPGSLSDLVAAGDRKLKARNCPKNQPASCRWKMKNEFCRQTMTIEREGVVAAAVAEEVVAAAAVEGEEAVVEGEEAGAAEEEAGAAEGKIPTMNSTKT